MGRSLSCLLGSAVEKYLGVALWGWRGCGVAEKAAEALEGEDLGINTLGQRKAGWFGGLRA